MKLRIGTLVAATMLSLTACGSISYADWAAKVDGLEEHKYAKATLVSFKETETGEDPVEVSNLSFTWNDDYGMFVPDSEEGYNFYVYVNITAKLVKAQFDNYTEEQLKSFSFGSDLSVSAKDSVSEQGASYSAEIKYEFDKYGYLTYGLEKEEVSYQGQSMSGSMEFKVSYSD